MSREKKVRLVSFAFALLMFVIFNLRAGYVEQLFDPSRAFDLLRTQSFWLNGLINLGLSGLLWLIIYRSMISRN